MLRTCSFFSLLLLATQSWAQSPPLGNEWIDYRQTYLKIPVAQPGIYRITSAELQRAGLPTATVDPTTIQLFHRGVEQAIYVAGESDKRFDPADFMEFYGRSNDGTMDSLLYHPVSAQPHQYYSLFSDTTAYFLTWRITGAGKPGKRMISYTDTAYVGLTPELYHWAEERRVFTDTYPGYPNGIPPKIEYSYYEAGEGYTGVVQQKDVPYDLPFVLDNAVRTGPAPQIDLLLAGRDYTNHYVECLAGESSKVWRRIDTATFPVYNNARIRQELAWTDVGTDGKLLISTVSRGDGSGPDRYSVSYVRLRYSQKINTDGQLQQTFRLAPNESGRSLADVGAVPADTRFWDITDPSAPIRLGFTTTPAGSARLVVRGTDVARTILRVDQPKPVPAIQSVTFTSWTNRRPTYLIVSHEVLMQPVGDTPDAVRSYAAYRASAAGGGHDTLTATMQHLFDQFSYGERHPLAIRRFADYLLRQSNGSSKRPRFLLLLGRSRSTPGIRRNPAQATLDMVMTAGYPGSDVVFTAGLNGFPADVPALMTGRVNAGTPQEVVNYLNKVKEYERPSAELWRKNVLHLSGGKTPAESVQFRRLMDGYRDQAVAQSLGARVTTLSKQTDNPVERIDVAGPVNEGVGLMTFFGHSGLDVTDLDIGFCSGDAFGYRNKGKYPFLLINGCAIGNFFFGRPTLATDWVMTPDRGAIAALAHTHLGYVNYLNEYTTTFYNLLTDSASLNKSIGYLQQETIRRVLARTPDGQALANCQQMILQGDPVIRLFPFATPDYGITAGGLTVWGADDKVLTTGGDSVRIRAVVQNSGQYRPGPLPVRVRRFVDGRESGVFNLTLPRSVAYRDTLTLTIPNERDAGGLNQFELTINPTGTIPETNRANNTATLDVTVAGRGPVLIYPPDSGTVSTRTVRLAAESFTTGNRMFELELDTTGRFDSPALVKQRIVADNGLIMHPATLVGPARTLFFWRVQAVGDAVWTTAAFWFDPTSTAVGLSEGQIRLAGKLPTDVRQGDTVTIPVQFVNLSPHPFGDSLVVRQTIYAAGLTNSQTKQWAMKTPVGADTLRIETRIATEFLPGLNRVLLTINPRLQPEYSFLNNTLDLRLPVLPDMLGPLLEVAIDGARIGDNAIVSARPVIDVLVADDNRSLIRRDTAGIDLYLQQAGQNQPIDQRNNRLNWRNATVQPTGADNVFRIRYPSADLSEGTYRLLVTARDVVGNPAMPYRVNFRVVNERSLTNLTVSPNPFRDRVLFSADLTGRQAPNSLIITIRDLTGGIVRQEHMVGRIGRNEWTWNGQSDAGRPLPAGMYLYDLTISDAGQDWPVADNVTGKLRGRLILTR